MQLSGKTALVTGASRGLGRAIAEGLARKGAKVTGTSRSPETVVWADGIQSAKLDLLPVDSLEEQWIELGWHDIEFDLVVNNAGSGFLGDFGSATWSNWRDQVDLGLLAPMRIAHLAWPGLERRRGTLVNVSSLAAELPIPYMAGYNVAKSGLSAFSSSLLLQRTQVRVIDFRPGDLQTSFNDALLKSDRGEAFRQEVDQVEKAMLETAEGMPDAHWAAARLLKLIEGGKRGPARTGAFFQSRVAPFFFRFLPASCQRVAIRNYFKLGRR